MGGTPAGAPQRGPALPLPPREHYARFALEGRRQGDVDDDGRGAAARRLLRDKTIGPRVVPIVADEARTFGMDSLFRQVGIYSPVGQLYKPEDASSMLYYRESQDGQLLEEGITEAGALSSWTAAATAYSVHGIPMLPFYIYYSMFGFQRVGDLIWAAADQRARGFLVGATAGRTTLGGEGLQHQDGTSHVIAATVPNCRAYDPAFAYELAVIFDHGARRMLEAGDDAFYYLTVMNENYAQPSMPDGVEGDIIRGMYRYATYDAGRPTARACALLGSGAILREVIAAAELLASEWDVASEVWSVTSYSELAREAQHVERRNRLHPVAVPRTQPRRDVAGGRGAGRGGERLRARQSARRSRPSCARGSSPWAPTASAAATRARRCARTSKSIARTSPSRRCRRWRTTARSPRRRSPTRSRATASAPAPAIPGEVDHRVQQAVPHRFRHRDVGLGLST